jgi:hypothetical protein
MKIVLEFNVPDDNYSMWCAYNADRMYSTITDIQQAIRAHYKYGQDISKTVDDINNLIIQLHNETGEPLP